MPDTDYQTQDILKDIPFNLPSEAAVLGAMLYDNRSFNRVEKILREGDFYSSAHASLFRKMKMLFAIGKVADGVTLSEFAKTDSDFSLAGGVRYLVELMEAAAFGPEIVDYARLISKNALQRKIHAAGVRMIETAVRGEASIESAMGELQAAMDDSRNDGDARDTRDMVSERFEEIVTEMEAGTPRGFMTGLPELDEATGGLKRQNLDILAGRPSMGKTGIATNIYSNMVQAGHKVGFFSIEMGETELSTRLASQAARKFGYAKNKYFNILNGTMSSQEIIDTRAAIQRISRGGMVDARSAPTFDQLASRARQMKRKLGGLDVIIIDYLGLMDLEEGRGFNKQLATGRMTARLKQLSKNLNICILLLCQLSRGPENRDNKRPILADLRDSGSIEQDADLVMFAYRDEYYIDKREPDFSHREAWMEWDVDKQASRNKLDIIIGKFRMGQTKTVKMHHELEHDVIHSPEQPLHMEALI